MCDLVIYELHVRGFTQHPSSKVKHRGFEGLREKIPYLKELGVNAVELMPIFEFDETMNAREVNGQKLLEVFWGYNTVSFLHQYQLYCTDSIIRKEQELKELIKELHEITLK